MPEIPRSACTFSLDNTGRVNAAELGEAWSSHLSAGSLDEGIRVVSKMRSDVDYEKSLNELSTEFTNLERDLPGAVSRVFNDLDSATDSHFLDALLLAPGRLVGTADRRRGLELVR